MVYLIISALWMDTDTVTSMGMGMGMGMGSVTDID